MWKSKDYFSSGMLISSAILVSEPLVAVPPPPPPASAFKFCEEKEADTLDLAAPKAEPIFWLAEIKLCELEMEDQTEAVLLLAAVKASPVFLYAWLSCKFLRPWVISSLNSRQAVMPNLRFSPNEWASLEASTCFNVIISSSVLPNSAFHSSRCLSCS